MKLVVLDGPMRGREFAIRGSPCIIGRDPGADVCLALDPHVALFHAQIRREGDRLWLEELAESRSANARVPLAVREPFTVGRAHLVLLDDAAASADALRELGTTGERPIERTGSRPVQLIAVPPSDIEKSVVATSDPSTVLTAPPVKANQAEAVRQVRNRLRIIQEVTHALEGKLDTVEMFEAVIDRVAKTLAAERAFVLAVGDGGQLSIVAARWADAPASVQARQPVLSRTIVDKVLRERVSLLIHDARMDDLLLQSPSIISSGYRSTMCVPLLQEGRATALLYLDSTEPRAFSEEELELVSVLANQAAAALTNTQLYGELRRTFEELESAHDQLVQTEKLSTIGALAASLSHDLRNILTPINAVAAMMLASDGVEPKLKRAFERQMQRLKALAQQLMSFSSPLPPEHAPVSLEQAVKDSLGLVETEALHRKVEIRTQLGVPFPPVAADLNRLDQAFVNLILNAIDAMEEGGGVLRIQTQADPDWVSISFADTGHGISEAHLGLLFKPFYTTKGKRGTGLGLFGCKRIVEEEHRGCIEVQSEAGVGTTFTLRFPRQPVVLVIAPDREVREGTKLLLDGQGFLVAATVTGEEASALVKGWTLDAVVLDRSRLGAAAGDALLRRLRLLPANALVPGLLLDAGDPPPLPGGASAGCDHLLPRDHPDRLGARLAQAITQRARLEAGLRPAVAGAAGERAAVRGALDAPGVWPLLAFLASEGASGRLVLVPSDRGESGRVTWHRGRPIAARLDGARPRKDAGAIAEFSAWTRGSYEFTPDDDVSGPAAAAGGDLLGDAAGILDRAGRAGL